MDLYLFFLQNCDCFFFTSIWDPDPDPLYPDLDSQDPDPDPDPQNSAFYRQDPNPDPADFIAHSEH